MTIGHLFEWARLALHVRAVTSQPPDLAGSTTPGTCSPRQPAAGATVPRASRTPLDWDDHVVVGARMHWVLCEAIAAAHVLAEATGDERLPDLRRRLAGPRRAAVRRPGHRAAGTTSSRRPVEVGSGTWAGQPDAYHLAQMLLLDGRPVRGSVAAALR